MVKMIAEMDLMKKVAPPFLHLPAHAATMNSNVPTVNVFQNPSNAILNLTVVTTLTKSDALLQQSLHLHPQWFAFKPVLCSTLHAVLLEIQFL